MLGVSPEKIRVLWHDADTHLFNQLSDEQLSTDERIGFEPDFSWQIPSEWLKLDLVNYFESRLVASGLDTLTYRKRVEAELQQVQQRNLQDLFRTIGYVVETFRNTGQVWGVGRGSSCASLLLFLIGIHQVDPVKYEIPMEEFFHD